MVPAIRSALDPGRPAAASSPSSPRIAVIGAGFAGIGAAVRLREAGFHDVTILERAGDVGGVWRDNTYPGCACDVQSHLYSLSFAPNPSWTRSYSSQPEIFAYLKRVAAARGVRPRFHHEVKALRWRDGAWHIETSRGAFVADVVVGAQGALSEPAVPSLPGIERFTGDVMHSARWNHDVDLRGRNVAVVGTGASAIQIIPAIAPLVGGLTVHQRTPPWIFPRNDRPISERRKRAYARAPVLQRMVRGAVSSMRGVLLAGFIDARAERLLRRLALRYLRASVKDPALRAKLTPGYAVGCKRILMSDDYYAALQRDNVELVVDGVSEVRERSIVDGAGVARDVDVIVLATGFRVTDPPMARTVFGRDGRTLKERWGDTPFAHVGTTIPGFPNFFLLQGPNTGLGHTSVLTMIEAQLDHVVDAVGHIAAHGAIEPTEEATARFLADVDNKMRGTVWVSGGCSSWYLDGSGRNSTLWPRSPRAFKKRAAFRGADYVCAGGAP